MAGSFENQAGPSYISSSYADNILSDVRPIKVKLEALRSVNVLLDEFLYKILSAAGSLSTDSIKAGLNKILPTTLGKDAVLEAELELKSYWERNTPHKPAAEEFDLQWSFELLRLKCEGYTTMNDTDEDAGAIKRVNDRMSVATGLSTPHTSLLAPASLYLTAILEHICQHVLSNVSLVTARDSSRTVATVHDLFTALCEDASLYGTFKSMNVYEQIDSLTKMVHPRRNKSLSKTSMNGRASPASRTASPIRDPSTSRLRVSSESTRPNIASTLGQQPASGSNEKSRVRLFGRSSSDHERSELPDPRLSCDDTENGNSFEVMDEEFDELMRSSATMKVSLTPDRLKSMEVYKQERKKHKVQEEDPTQTSSTETRRAGSVRRLRPVDSIQEDDELAINAMPSTTSTSIINTNNTFQNVIMPRARLTSLATSPMSTSSTPVNARSRSVTISAPLSKKRSIGQMRPPPLLSSTVFPPKRSNTHENVPSMQNGRPPRTRKITRNRESMDLDEVMGEADEFGGEPMTPRRRDASKPYISKSARDLIDFLDEGPPMEQLRPPNMSMNASMISLESTKTTRSGRLQRMMSKLTLGSSNEKLNGRTTSSTDESNRSSRASRRSPSNSSLASSPPSSYALPMTPKKLTPTVIVATPPPPLSSLTSMSSISTDSSYPSSNAASGPPSNVSTLSNGVPRPAQQRRISITRKAVPAWEEENTEQVIIVPSTTPKSEKHRSKPSPLDAFPPVPETVNLDGRILPNGHVEVIAEMQARRESRTPSPLDATQFRRASLSPDTPPTGSQSAPTTPTPSTTPPPRPTYSLPPVPADMPQPDTVPEETSDVEVEQSQEGAASPGPEAEPEHEPESEPVPEAKTDVPDVPAPAFTADDARDLRRLLSVATTADECRLLVEMFLARSGLSAPALQLQETPCEASDVEAVASELQDANDDLERSLVSLLLGEEAQTDIEIPTLPPSLDPTPPSLVYSVA